MPSPCFPNQALPKPPSCFSLFFQALAASKARLEWSWGCWVRAPLGCRLCQRFVIAPLSWERQGRGDICAEGILGNSSLVPAVSLCSSPAQKSMRDLCPLHSVCLSLGKGWQDLSSHPCRKQRGKTARERGECSCSRLLSQLSSDRGGTWCGLMARATEPPVSLPSNSAHILHLFHGEPPCWFFPCF